MQYSILRIHTINVNNVTWKSHSETVRRTAASQSPVVHSSLRMQVWLTYNRQFKNAFRYKYTL